MSRIYEFHAFHFFFLRLRYFSFLRIYHGVHPVIVSYTHYSSDLSKLVCVYRDTDYVFTTWAHASRCAPTNVDKISIYPLNRSTRAVIRERILTFSDFWKTIDFVRKVGENRKNPVSENKIHIDKILITILRRERCCTARFQSDSSDAHGGFAWILFFTLPPLVYDRFRNPCAPLWIGTTCAIACSSTQ